MRRDGGDDLRQPVELLLQRRLVGLGVGEQVGDVADLGVHAGGGDDDLAAAAGDRGVHVGHARAVPERHVVTRHRGDRLADREALAGERGLLDLEGRGDADPAVGRDPVAGLDQHDVARHQLLGVDLDGLAVPAYPGDGLHHLGQRLDALLGLGLLAQADHRVEQGQSGQDHRRAHVAGDDQVHDGRDQQDDLHEVAGTAGGRPGRPDSFLAAVSRLGPWDSSRARASSALSPWAGSTPRACATALASRAATGPSIRTSVCETTGHVLSASDPPVSVTTGRLLRQIRWGARGGPSSPFSGDASAPPAPRDNHPFEVTRTVP